jgi:hypothetical protein
MWHIGLRSSHAQLRARLNRIENRCWTAITIDSLKKAAAILFETSHIDETLVLFRL